MIFLDFFYLEGIYNILENNFDIVYNKDKTRKIDGGYHDKHGGILVIINTLFLKVFCQSFGGITTPKSFTYETMGSILSLYKENGSCIS